jgi:hypothetical protein
MDNARKVVSCELFNTLAWICGFSSDLVVDNFVNVNSKENAKLMTITQDLVSLASKQRNRTPKSACYGASATDWILLSDITPKWAGAPQIDAKKKDLPPCLCRYLGSRINF